MCTAQRSTTKDVHEAKVRRAQHYRDQHIAEVTVVTVSVKICNLQQTSAQCTTDKGMALQDQKRKRFTRVLSKNARQKSDTRTPVLRTTKIWQEKGKVHSAGKDGCTICSAQTAQQTTASATLCYGKPYKAEAHSAARGSRSTQP